MILTEAYRRIVLRPVNVGIIQCTTAFEKTQGRKEIGAWICQKRNGGATMTSEYSKMIRASKSSRS